MPATFHPDYNPMIRKLESIFTLSDDEKQALLSLPMQVMAIKADQNLVRRGDRPSRSCLILSGFSCTYKVTARGKRQIVSFNLPGDVPDLQSLHLRVLDNGISTLTPCSVGFIPHEILHDICDRYPRIAAAFWRETLIDTAIFREWVLNVGQREAYQRMAHVLCELLVRLEGISSIEAANAFLPGFMDDYNRRFAKVPFSAKDLHRPLSEHDDLDDTFAWQEERTVTKDLTLQYDQVLFLLEPNAITRSLARQRVMVYDYPDGRFAIKHQGRELPYRTFDRRPQVSQGAIVENKRLGPVLAYIAERPKELDMSRSKSAPRRRGQAKNLFKVG
jgi:CRP-like cAMP-binding protein